MKLGIKEIDGVPVTGSPDRSRTDVSGVFEMYQKCTSPTDTASTVQSTYDPYVHLCPAGFQWDAQSGKSSFWHFSCVS